jgi:OmcA/MtrC family decaheme c-type cytochrome
VVDDYNCEGCHDNLALHGGNRHNPQYCVTCHRPDMLASAEGAVSQSVHFKYMIHKIHASEELANGYGLPGRSGETTFEIGYPGDLRNCEKCHVNDSYQLPLPEGVLATITPRELWTPMEPIAASCVGCHDSTSTVAHMDANTSFFGESCSTCHGAGKDFAVEKVHAR